MSNALARSSSRCQVLLSLLADVVDDLHHTTAALRSKRCTGAAAVVGIGAATAALALAVTEVSVTVSISSSASARAARPSGRC